MICIFFIKFLYYTSPPKIEVPPQFILIKSFQKILHIMNHYHQLEQISLRNIDETDLNQTMRKLHMLNKADTNYKTLLEETFGKGLTSMNYEEYLKIGFWFAEIYNLDPNYSHKFSNFRNSFYTGALENFVHNEVRQKNLAAMAARLIDHDELHDLFRNLKTIVTQKNEYKNQIKAILHFINEVVILQTDRKAIYLKNRSCQALKMTKNILKEFKQMPDLNTPNFLPQKIKVLHSIVLYLQSQSPQKNKTTSDYVLSFKAAIIEQITDSQEVNLLDKDQDIFLKFLEATIKLYGIYDQTKIEKLLRKLKLKTENINYLNFLKTIAEHLTQEISPRIKQDMQNISQTLISKFFSNEFRNLDELFKVLKTKSDIIIEGNKINFINFTRYLSQYLDKTYISYHKMFLISLLTIYNPTIRTDVKKQFAREPCALNMNKHQTIYYQMIEYFASMEFQVIDYILDPETIDNLVWGLLALRNSIKVNYNFLSQQNFVSTIFRNLVKLMLANISSKQCMEISEQILIKSLNSQNTWRQLLNYAVILSQFRQFAFTIPVQALKNFSHLLKKHIQIIGSEFFDNLNFFKQLCILSTKIFQEMSDQKQQLKTKYTQIFFNLLRASIPRNKSARISLNQVYEARDHLINLIAFDQKYAFYLIYLDLAFAYRQTDAFEGIVTYPRIIYNQIYQKLDDTISRKFKIMSLIGSKIQVSFEEIQSNWKRFMDSIYQRDTDLGLYLLLLNQYFLNQLKQQVFDNSLRAQYRLLLKIQLCELNSALSLIHRLIEEQSLVSSLQNLLEINSALSFNLYIVLTEIVKDEGMIRLQQHALLDLSQNMLKWFKILDRIGNKQFLRQQKGKTVSLWQTAQIHLIMIASLNHKTCAISHREIDFSYEVMNKKLQSITNNFSQDEKKNLDLLFSQLFSPIADVYLSISA